MSDKYPTYQRIVEVRASSWGRLFDCAHAWEAEHIIGLRRPAFIRTHLGTSIHASTAAFDKARMDGSPITASEAADVFIDTLHNPTEEVDYKRDTSISMREAEVIGLALHAKYCTEISPRYEFKAVEMTMTPVEIDCGNGITIRLKGTMDRARVATESGKTVIPDIKTGGRLISEGKVVLKARSAQLGAYQLMYEDNAGEHTDGSQIIALQTTKDALVGVSRVFDAKRAMIGTSSQPGMLEYAAVMFKSGMFPPNPSSSLCSQKFCARWDTCLYRDE
ncbi:PD-(D/E)XK nuclease family protein [Burkholderia anthina]|uniref:PD-(D/E)XK nuclease family protein n=1 Tax=Burkholderia anthina TaxID=179879 RepID=UPI00158D6673|nr:PD-(D/E)XK nuclease family protein [Burkholderia anthina]